MCPSKRFLHLSKVDYLRIRRLEEECGLEPLPLPEGYETRQRGGAQSRVTVDAVLKELYIGPIEEQLRQKTVILGEFEKKLDADKH